MDTENTNYNLKETPWYFGAYLNMAEHNVLLINNHLTEKFSYLKFDKIKAKEILSQKHLLLNIFDTKRKEFDGERFKVYKYLVKRNYLPFIKIFHAEKGLQLDSNPIVNYNELHAFLQDGLESLTEFRNSYSHYLAIDSDGKKMESRKQKVPENVKEGIEQLFKDAPIFSLKRFKETQQKVDFDHSVLYQLFEENSTKLTEHGFYFFINLFLERSYAYKFLKRISGFKNETTPAFKATLQTFTAYSLRLPDIRLDNDDRKNSLLLEMLNELQRCPKELYRHLNEEDKKRFEPNIEDNEKSNIVLNSKNYRDIRDEDIDNLLSEQTRLKRKGNHFPYFALWFIDEYNLLPNIRFQIILGKLQTDNYDKNIINVKTNRRILKRINAYGKLSNFKNRETEVLSELKKEFKDNEKVYFEQYNPHYNLINNKIPFYLFKDKGERIKYPNPLIDKKEEETFHNKPTGFISLNDLPKLILLAYFNKNEAEKVIEGFITKNHTTILNLEELKAIKNKFSLVPKEFTRRVVKEKKIQEQNGKRVFLNNEIREQILKDYKLFELSKVMKLTSEEVKNKIKNEKDREYVNQIRYISYLSERKKELQNHLPNDILVNQLPTQVLNYLLNISDRNSEKVINDKIKAIKDNNKWRLKIIKKELEKDKEKRNLKLGELATFLARDIIEMVIDKEVKQKITSPYYNKLQNKIAYFSSSKSEIIELCNELALFDKKIGHVFLTESLINDAHGIIEFYENYLKAKNDWIKENLLIEGRTGRYIIPNNDKIPYSFIKMRNSVEQNDFKNWLTNKSAMPIELPTSLFNNSVENKLSQELHKKNIPFNKNDRFSIRLSKWLEGDIQPFYKFKRVYKLNYEPVEFDIGQLDGKTLKNKYGRRVEQNEKAIRFVQTQDCILKLLCEKIILDDDKGNENKICLTDMIPFSEKSPLNRPARFKHNITRKGKDNYFTIIAVDNKQQKEEIEEYKRLTIEEDKENFKGQKGYQWTMKDFGLFKRLVNDRRIPNLSKYFKNEEITFDFLRYQLLEYDKYREKIFHQTFKLEEQIVENAFEEIKEIELKVREKNQEEFNEVQFKVFLKWIKEKELLDDDEIVLLRKIRDKYAHSEFPDYYSEITKLTKTDNKNFESVKSIKGEVEKLNLSISEKNVDTYCSLIDKITK